MSELNVLSQNVRTVVFVDTRNRALKLYAASVTILEKDYGNNAPAVVLRFAGELGTLHQLETSEQFLNFEGAHLLIPAEGYQAQSSSGFVEHMPPFNHGSVCRRVVVVGLAGFPWMNSPALRPIKPFWAVLYRQEVSLRAPSRHGNSNSATANALRIGVKAISRLYTRKGYIIEGQSDYAKVFELSAHPGLFETEVYYHFQPDFAEEHRKDLFTLDKVLNAGLRSAAKGDRVEVLRSLVRIVSARKYGLDWTKYVHIDSVISVFGREEIESFAREVCSLDRESLFPSEKEAWIGVIRYTKVCPKCGRENDLGYNREGTHCSCWTRGAAGEVVTDWEGAPSELIEVAYLEVQRQMDPVTGKYESVREAASRMGTYFAVVSGFPQWE